MSIHKTFVTHSSINIDHTLRLCVPGTIGTLTEQLVQELVQKLVRVLILEPYMKGQRQTVADCHQHVCSFQGAKPGASTDTRNISNSDIVLATLRKIMC